VEKQHNEEMHNLYSSPSIIRIMKSTRIRLVCSSNGAEEDLIQVIVGKSEGKRLLGR
jgi:hypothetical protein